MQTPPRCDGLTCAHSAGPSVAGVALGKAQGSDVRMVSLGPGLHGSRHHGVGFWGKKADRQGDLKQGSNTSAHPGFRAGVKGCQHRVFLDSGQLGRVL